VPEVPAALVRLLLDLQIGQEAEDGAEEQPEPDLGPGRHAEARQSRGDPQCGPEDQAEHREQHLGGQEDLEGQPGQGEALPQRGKLPALFGAQPRQPRAKPPPRARGRRLRGTGPVAVRLAPRIEGGQPAGQPRPRRVEREPEQEQPEAGESACEECRCHDAPPCQAAIVSGSSGVTIDSEPASSRSGTGNRASARIHTIPAAYSPVTTPSTSCPVTLS